MRARSLVVSALIAGAASALLYASPRLVDYVDSPCTPTVGFPGKSAVDHQVDATLRGCYAIRKTADGAVVTVGYYMSDAQYRHDPEVEANTIQIYDQLYSVVWRRLPYRIRRIEIHAEDVFGGPDRVSVVAANTLEARFGSRPPGLQIVSTPPSKGEQVGAITQPITWVLITTTGVLLVAAATRAVRNRRCAKQAKFRERDSLTFR